MGGQKIEGDSQDAWWQGERFDRLLMPGGRQAGSLRKLRSGGSRWPERKSSTLDPQSLPTSNHLLYVTSMAGNCVYRLPVVVVVVVIVRMTKCLLPSLLAKPCVRFGAGNSAFAWVGCSCSFPPAPGSRREGATSGVQPRRCPCDPALRSAGAKAAVGRLGGVEVCGGG